MNGSLAQLNGQAGKIAAYHIESVVGGEILNPIAAALAQIQRAAEGAVRCGEADVNNAHVHAPFIGIGTGYAVTDTAISAPVTVRAPSAIALAHSALTGPNSSRSSCGTPSMPFFTEVQ